MLKALYGTTDAEKEPLFWSGTSRPEALRTLWPVHIHLNEVLCD